MNTSTSTRSPAPETEIATGINSAINSATSSGMASGATSAAYAQRLAVLRDAARSGLLARGARGIEKESLRVLADGTLATTPHPAALGAALTHPEVTTDYSEALLEFITPPEPDPATALARLHALHAYVHRHIGGELLWDLSLPGVLPRDADIPIAHYGRSNQGRFKHVYRQGLAVRYGRAMQCIAGIHYNFSLDEALWTPLLQQGAHPSGNVPPDDAQSEGYMRLMRNYRRFSWLLLYLFGASPALDQSFFDERQRSQSDPTSLPARLGLQSLSPDTWFLPYATSLRMSDLGYHNEAMRERRPDLTSLPRYIAGLEEAIAAPYAPYAAIGTHRDGEWVQLNTNLLQIENELYATIRPKRASHASERVVHALTRAGIQYVEVRCLDLDPFEPIGISESTVRFLDAFLLMCALEDSPDAAGLQVEADANFLLVAREGRRPGLTLSDDGRSVTRDAWAHTLFDRMAVAADLLDEARRVEAGGAASAGVEGAAGFSAAARPHADALARQRIAATQPDALPSARVLDQVRAAGSYKAFGLEQSRQHARHFAAAPLDAEFAAYLDTLTVTSAAQQSAIEAADEIDFDTFVQRFGQSPVLASPR